MRIPWLVIGLLVGCLFMRTWPGQDEIGVMAELATRGGAGLLAGLVLDYVAQRVRKSNQVSVGGSSGT